MALSDNLLAEKEALISLLESEYPTQNLRDSLLGRLYTIRFLLGELGSSSGDVGTLVLAVFKATDAGTGYLLNDIIVLQQTPPANPIYVNARTGATITPDPADLGSVSTASNVSIATALPTGTNSIGQITANAGTNLNTSALALEAGGNIEEISDTTALNNGSLPTRTVLVGGKHDSEIRSIAVDNNGHIILNTGGQQLKADSISVTIASDQDSIGSIDNTTFAATQSGTWNLTNITGTISLPTGAATESKQDTGNTSLSNINTKLPASVGAKASTGSLSVTQAYAATSTLANVSAATSSTTLLNANNARKTVVIVNDSTATLYINLNASVASTTNYSILLPPISSGIPSQLILKGEDYSGEIRGIWSAVNGAARITEVV